MYVVVLRMVLVVVVGSPTAYVVFCVLWILGVKPIVL